MTNGQNPVEQEDEATVAKEDEGGLMTALEHGLEEIKTQPAEVVFVDVIKLELPYIAMLSMAVLGIAIITLTGQPAPLYWEVLTPVYCGICIYLGWGHADSREKRVELVWTQILHWFAVLVAMWFVHLELVGGVVNNNATGLNLMTILALATFIAGVHAKAWQIYLVGARRSRFAFPPWPSSSSRPCSCWLPLAGSSSSAPCCGRRPMRKGARSRNRRDKKANEFGETGVSLAPFSLRPSSCDNNGPARKMPYHEIDAKP